LKIAAASCRESPKCKEADYCNSLANPQQAVMKRAFVKGKRYI